MSDFNWYFIRVGDEVFVEIISYIKRLRVTAYDDLAGVVLNGLSEGGPKIICFKGLN